MRLGHLALHRLLWICALCAALCAAGSVFLHAAHADPAPGAGKPHGQPQGTAAGRPRGDADQSSGPDVDFVRDDPSTGEPSDPPASKPSDTSGGKFVLTLTHTSQRELKKAEALVRDSRFFDDVIQELNRTLKIPRDIPVSFEDCDEDNAFYDSEGPKIIICYELIEGARKLFASNDEDQADADSLALEATLFTLLHELGHSLVDQLKIPITGREEDAVDDLALIILLRDPAGEETVWAALEHFGAEADEEMASTMDDIAFWGEHSLTIQRFYNMSCLLYGSNPSEFEDLLVGDDEAGLLPTERAEMCPEEFETKRRNWNILLKDAFR
jgi:hypothetical protein